MSCQPKLILFEDFRVCRIVENEENSIFINAFRGIRSSFLNQVRVMSFVGWRVNTTPLPGISPSES